MEKILTIILFFVLNITFCYSDDKINLDSILTIKNENLKFSLLRQHAKDRWFSDPKTSLEISNTALKLSEKQSDIRIKSNAYFDVAVAYYLLSNYDSSLVYVFKSNDLYKSINYQLGIANSYRLIADNYCDKSYEELAFKYYQISLNYFEKVDTNKIPVKDYLRLYAILLNNYATLLLNTSDFKEAEKYFLRSIELYRKAKNIQGEMIAIYNIAVCRHNLKDEDNAFKYFEQAYQLANLTNNLNIKANALQGLGLISETKKDYKNALKNYKESMPHLYQLNFVPGILYNYSNIGNCYLLLGDYHNSLKYIDTLYTLSEKFENDEFKLRSLSQLADIYYKLGDFKKAFEYSKLYSLEKDTVTNIEITNTINDLNRKYDIEKKENENRILTQKSELQSLRNQQLSIIIIFLIIFLAFSIFLLYLLSKKNKENNKMMVLLKEKNQKIEEDGEVLKEMNKIKDRLFSIVSHDLKNSFGTLKTATLMLHTEYNSFDEDEKREFFKYLSETSDKLFILLTNLLDWSRSQLGSIKFNPKEINLKSVVDDTLSLIEPLANEKDITLQNLIDSDINIFADKDINQAIIRNLVSNSVKFTNNFGRVSISYKPQEFSHQIIVEDNGIGMSQEHLENIFNITKNVTTYGTNNEKGMGLGLVLCKELAEKHNGQLFVESEAGKGTKMILELVKK